MGVAGWSRRRGGCRLYLERAEKTYLLVIEEEGPLDTFSAIGNVLAGSNPSLGSTSTDKGYLRNHCKRVEWCELPAIWKNAFRNVIAMNEWEHTPEQIRGFWKLGNPEYEGTPKRNLYPLGFSLDSVKGCIPVTTKDTKNNEGEADATKQE